MEFLFLKIRNGEATCDPRRPPPLYPQDLSTSLVPLRPPENSLSWKAFPLQYLILPLAKPSRHSFPKGGNLVARAKPRKEKLQFILSLSGSSFNDELSFPQNKTFPSLLPAFPTFFSGSRLVVRNRKEEQTAFSCESHLYFIASAERHTNIVECGDRVAEKQSLFDRQR